MTSDPSDYDPFDDQFKPVTREDMTDIALLPRRFDMFANEVRQSFEILTDKIMPFMQRMEHAVTDIAERVSRLEHHRVDIARRLEALEKRSRRKAKT